MHREGRRRLRVLCLGALYLAPGFSFPRLARAACDAAAAASPPSPAQKEEADRHFARGEAAFRHGDYRAAGEEFDAAYALAPHHDALWNSAEAWELGQELARAASRYAAYLDVAPGTAADRSRATAALARLAPRLARIDVHGAEGARAEVDREAVACGRAYVYPGSHEVVIYDHGNTDHRTLVLRAGDVQSLAVAQEGSSPPAPEPPPVPVARPKADVFPASADLHETAPKESPSGGLSPWTVVAGGAATLVAGGFTLWSGLDTLSARNRFLADPNADTLQSGRSSELRTNILIATTGTLALATAVVAVFFVRWRSGDVDAAALVGPGGAALRLTY